MSKKRSLLADYCVYLLVRGAVCLIQALSLNASRSLALALAWLAYRVDRRHRLTALDNLRHAFPGEYSETELEDLVQGVYRHFCTLAIEIVHLPRKLHVHTWRRYMDLKGGGYVMDCLLSRRPVMIVTGHLGNWEISGHVLSLVGFAGHAIARPLDNPFLENYLLRLRENTGQRILSKKGDFEQIESILAGGGVMATLADQDAGQRGLFVDFFGRPASTHKAVALLALEHRVPLVVTGSIKVGEPMRYQIVVADVIFPEEYEGRADAVRAITQRFTTALERLVRSAPEQYFWLHRRWKHQPAKARRRVA
jgi:KDO2-lipid IV(A) lauroyltransferase